MENLKITEIKVSNKKITEEEIKEICRKENDKKQVFSMKFGRSFDTDGLNDYVELNIK